VLTARPERQLLLRYVVQRGAMRTMAKPPSPSIRLTITVSPEVHEAFTRMAAASSMSLGRCMGEWLADTIEGAEFVTAQMVKAREAPRQVAKDLRQMALGAVDLADDLLADMRSGKLARPATAGAKTLGSHQPALAAPTSPRPVIRGGKSPGKTRTNRPAGGSK
jgi:hypothetical protein